MAQTVDVTAKIVGRKPVGKAIPVGRVGGIYAGLDIGSRLAAGQKPADAVLSAAGGAIGSLLGSPLGILGETAGYAAGAAALPWLPKALRTPQGEDFKRELYQGNIGGAFQALGIGRSNPPKLRQYNPPGFVPGQPVTGADIVQSTAEVASAKRKPGTQAVLNGRPVQWTGSRWQETTPFQPEGPTYGSVQQERAYREQAINTAQQTAQNPLFQKYRVADLTKQYNEAKTPEEKQNVGMQIWAQTNPLLAAKLKTGQTGYAQAQAAPGMSNAQGALLGGVPMPTANFNFATDVAPAFTTQQTFGDVIPGPGMVSATPMIANNANLFGSGLSEMPAGINSTQASQAATAMPAGFDPAAVNISPDQRKALIQQYLRGIK